MAKTHAPAPALGSFEADAAEILLRIRASFAELVSHAAAGNRPADLQRSLGIDYKMSWRLSRIAESGNPLDAGQHVPGPTSMRRLLRAAARKGVPERVVRAATEASRDLEALIERHAGDRSTFDAMIAAVSGNGLRQIQLDQKRMAFRANANLVGTRVQTSLVAHVLAPSAQEGRADLCSIIGRYKFHRLHPVAMIRLFNDSLGATRDRVVPGGPIPLGKSPIGLLPEHSTVTEEELERRVSEDGRNVEYVRRGSGIGLTDEVDFTLAHTWGPVLGTRRRDEKSDVLQFDMQLSDPAELLVRELLIHKDVYDACGGRPPEIRVYTARTLGKKRHEAGDTELLPVEESVEHLGRGLDAARSPDVPRYGDLIARVFAELGHDTEDFEVFRSRVHYPMLYSVTSLQLPLAP